MGADLVTSDDGLARCGWGDAPPIYRAYHDDEWGVAVHGRDPLFERISLEAFQSGLSWLTVLRKRENFRTAFAGFDAAVVAGFGEPDVARLLADPGIIRNRAKITATVDNARAVLDVDDLDALLWSFAPTGTQRPATAQQVPTTTPASVALAKELKRRGLRFVGPTTAHALMQATGMVEQHLAGCWRTPSR